LASIRYWPPMLNFDQSNGVGAGAGAHPGMEQSAMLGGGTAGGCAVIPGTASVGASIETTLGGVCPHVGGSARDWYGDWYDCAEATEAPAAHKSAQA
jgi:hypothetical protein